MMSKKKALTLGILLIGGIAAASAVAGGAGGGGAAEGGAGGILGTFGGAPQGIVGGETQPAVYQIPAETFTGFPEQKDYTGFLSQFLTPQAPIDRSRGKAGVSSPKKEPFDALQISLTQPLFSDTARTFTPQAYHPSLGLAATTAPPKKSYETSSAPIGTPAAQMPVYNPYYTPTAKKSSGGGAETGYVPQHVRRGHTYSGSVSSGSGGGYTGHSGTGGAPKAGTSRYSKRT